jgi:hypothetical protein
MKDGKMLVGCWILSASGSKNYRQQALLGTNQQGGPRSPKQRYWNCYLELMGLVQSAFDSCCIVLLKKGQLIVDAWKKKKS